MFFQKKRKPFDLANNPVFFLQEQEEHEGVLEAGAAEEWGLDLGDRLFVWTETREGPTELEIVGLVDRRRVPALQAVDDPQVVVAHRPLGLEPHRPPKTARAPPAPSHPALPAAAAPRPQPDPEPRPARP